MEKTTTIKISIVIPVYNDWESLNKLITGLDSAFSFLRKDIICYFSVLIVNDGSILPPNIDRELFRTSCLDRAEVLHLVVNVGHQRAIAIALAHLQSTGTFDAVIVMDADGEDRPEDALKLLTTYLQQPEKIILAARTRRSESFIFRCGYMIYRNLFKILCGSTLNFGNFCLIPTAFLPQLVHLSDLWNHFASGIVRSKLPFISVATQRGKRFIGHSHMNFVKLIIHGLSAISVHLDTVAVRIVIATSTLILLSGMGFLVVAVIRLFTDLAIPGWASVVGLLFLGIAVQGIFMTILFIFFFLNSRQQKMFIPQIEFNDYIRKLEKVYEKND